MTSETASKVAIPFTFERSFDREGTTAAAPKRKMMSHDEIELLRREAHDAGRREGEQSAARRQADAINALTLSVETLGAQVTEAVGPFRDEAVTLAYVIALKLAHRLVQQQPRAELEALITRCIDEHKSEPHLVFRVNDTLHDEIKALCEKLSGTRGFTGRIHVIGEPNIDTGDCMIEWADGGLERRMGTALAEIDTIVRGYLSASGDQAGALPPVDDVLQESEGEQLNFLAPDDKGSE